MTAIEKNELDSVSRELAAIKRWWPIIASIFAIAGMLITLTINLTSTYDNKIAKKEDTDSIKRELRGMRSDMADIKNSLKDFKNQHIVDMTNVDNRVTSVDGRTTTLEKRVDGIYRGFIGELKDKNGNIITSRAN